MIKIGTAFQLETLNDDGQTYKCKMIDAAEGKIYIDYPINEKTNRSEIFSLGTPFRIYFHQNGAVYNFFTELISKQKLKGIPACVLSFDDHTILKRIQRRKFVRVETMLDVSIKTSTLSFATITADLSGGGMAVVLKNDQLVSPGEQLDIMLVLPINDTIEYIHLTGRALRIYEREEGGRILSIHFEEILARHQQLIVRHCYLRQLADRQKGLSSN